MFNKKDLIGISVDRLVSLFEVTFNGEFLALEIGEDSFYVNVSYRDSEDCQDWEDKILKDMELMGIEDDINCFVDERVYEEGERMFNLAMSLKDVSKIINKASNEVLSSSLQYFYDSENEYIQFITE